MVVILSTSFFWRVIVAFTASLPHMLQPCPISQYRECSAIYGPYQSDEWPFLFLLRSPGYIHRPIASVWRSHNFISVALNAKAVIDGWDITLLHSGAGIMADKRINWKLPPWLFECILMLKSRGSFSNEKPPCDFFFGLPADMIRRGLATLLGFSMASWLLFALKHYLIKTHYLKL